MDNSSHYPAKIEFALQRYCRLVIALGEFPSAPPQGGSGTGDAALSKLARDRSSGNRSKSIYPFPEACAEQYLDMGRQPVDPVAYLHRDRAGAVVVR